MEALQAIILVAASTRAKTEGAVVRIKRGEAHTVADAPAKIGRMTGDVAGGDEFTPTAQKRLDPREVGEDRASGAPMPMLPEPSIGSMATS